jgi:hypothetical protein
MITINKSTIFSMKWAEKIHFDRLLPVFHLNSSPGNKSQNKLAGLSFRRMIQNVPFWQSRTPSDETGIYDSSQIEAELRQSGSLSSTCALLGVCEDGLPFILDFSNPAPGSILIAGDTGSGKSLLLDCIAGSSSRVSQPDLVNITWVSQEESGDFQISSVKEFLGEIAENTKQLPALMKSILEEMDQRKKNCLENQVHLFFINDLLALVAGMDTETLSMFYRIIRHGPRYRLWTVAGLNSHDIPALEPRILDAFRTHLICGIQDKKLVQELSGNCRLNTNSLNFGSQFFVPYGEQWLRSWICQPSAGQGMEVGS